MEPKSAREVSEGASDIDIKALKQEIALLRGIPLAQYQYVDVTFNSVADTDTDISHTLKVTDPEEVDWEVVRWSFSSAPGGGVIVYKDSSATRRPWGVGYITLRCNIDSAQATLRLSARRR